MPPSRPIKDHEPAADVTLINHRTALSTAIVDVIRGHVGYESEHVGYTMPGLTNSQKVEAWIKSHRTYGGVHALLLIEVVDVDTRLRVPDYKRIGVAAFDGMPCDITGIGFERMNGAQQLALLSDIGETVGFIRDAESGEFMDLVVRQDA